MPDAHLSVFRGGPGEEGRFESYDVPVEEGMVVLDALHWIQGNAAPDLAVRWNCKAAKCGSCSGEVNGQPRLMCKTRLDSYPQGEAITVKVVIRRPDSLRFRFAPLERCIRRPIYGALLACAHRP